MITAEVMWHLAKRTKQLNLGYMKVFILYLKKKKKSELIKETLGRGGFFSTVFPLYN